jgi:Zn-dependent protease with chaperone function
VTGGRVPFFEEQARNRRATWRLAAASAASVVVMGVPVSLVISPLVYGVGLIAAECVHLVHPLPDSITSRLAAAVSVLQAVVDDGRVLTHVPAVPLALVAAAVLAPGVLVMLGLWITVRADIVRSGVGGVLPALGARSVRGDDLEELQLQNVAEEMAIAAGVAPPRVLLLDAAAANAALCGSRAGTAMLVISRGLLDAFSREETQAIVAHLIGSAGNGDLVIASDLAALFQTQTRLTAMLDAPFGAAPVDEDHPGWRTPLMLASQSVKWTVFLCTSVVVAPMVALLWRARRYLADATAVQLTRNPEALWQALMHLARGDGAIAGGAPASYLFIVDPTQGTATADKMGTNSLLTFHPRLDRRLRRLERQGAASRIAHASGRPWPHRLAASFGTAIVGLVFGIGLLAGAAGLVIFVGISLMVDVLALEAVHGVFALLGVIKAATLG